MSAGPPASPLEEIHQGTASATGREFFDRLVLHLARALGVRHAWVTEYLERPRRLRALAFWAGDRYVHGYEYPVRGTPCAAVIDRCELVVVPDRVIKLYPDDPDLPPLGAISYMGTPLIDRDGRILGHLAILHDEPLGETPESTAIFRIFGARAAAELARDRQDRELRAREARLTGLVSHVPDAIVELDRELRILRANPAALRTFGHARLPEGGVPAEALLTPSGLEELARVAGELESRPESERFEWIPEGVEGRRADGTTFPAEGTLALYEVDGRPVLTLLLRNRDERREAERRIRELMREADELREEVRTLSGWDEIVGTSPPIRAMLQDIEGVAPTLASVLVTGETGTGKELVARAIHRRSGRAAGPLVRVNCAAIPEHLQESEFFGHERGAFTGATQRRDGRFRLADRGTIFLDEVGEMPLDLQAKLLRVLQEGEFERVGGTRTERVDVRVIAATNRDLARLVREGRFREDLLYRLNVFPIHVPPLRDRGDDVLLLAETFLERLARPLGISTPELDGSMRARLRAYDWPGNVRELRNVLERALITSRDGRTPNLERALPNVPGSFPPDTPGVGVRTVDAGEGAGPVGPAPILTADELRALERANLLRALEAADWKLSGPGGASELLGIHPNTLASRMRAMGIRRPAPC